ncbi:MAG: cupin domain-containing protein [Nitrospira sp. LK70]|nr:cupin domain-containing protein [Nitrospira sp. LK70]
MRNILFICWLVSLISSPVLAQQSEVTPLFSKDLADMPGKEGVMITVTLPPDASDPVHRHNAHTFVYVLEGSIVMQVEGGKQVILTPGQTFYEGPNDVHTVGRNASKTVPAKFVVFFLKDKKSPLLELVK